MSATVPPEIQRLMNTLLPGMKPLRTSSLHKAIAGSRHQFVAVPPGGNKLEVAVQLMQGDAAKGRRVLAFCGTVDSCRALDHYCRVRALPRESAVCCCWRMSQKRLAGHQAVSQRAVGPGGSLVPSTSLSTNAAGNSFCPLTLCVHGSCRSLASRRCATTAAWRRRSARTRWRSLRVRLRWSFA